MLNRRQVLLATAAAAAAAGVGATSALAQSGPIKIGLTGPFTGGSSSMGVSMRDGVKLAIADIKRPAACWAGSWLRWSATTRRATRSACRSRRS